MQLFSADTKKNENENFAPPKHKKECPQKLLIILLDQEFLVQQVFTLCN